MDCSVHDSKSKNNYNLASYRLDKLKARNPNKYNTLLLNMEHLVHQFDVESKNILERAHKLYSDKRACGVLFMKLPNAVYIYVYSAF
jgi:hypothetical protein